MDMIQNIRVTEAGWTGYGRLDQQERPVATEQSGETTGQDAQLPETPATQTCTASDQQAQPNPAALPSGDPMSTTLGKMSLQPNAFFPVNPKQPPVQTTAPAPAPPSAAAQADIDALGQAAASGDLKKVQDLINSGVDINGRDRTNKQTALMQALAAGKNDVAKFLLDHNADPNIADINKQMPLHLAASAGDSGMIQSLRQHGALTNIKDDFGHTPLMLAADKGDAKAIGALTSGRGGADVNLKDVTGNTALMHAVVLGKPEAVKALLDKSNLALKDDSQRNALALAARQGNPECTKALIDKIAGLDPKTRAAIFNNQDDSGRTALMDAIQKGNDDVAEQLTKNTNVLVNLQDNDGKTALHEAAEKGRARDLVSRGADPNRADLHGATPLMVAAQNGHGGSVEAMLHGKPPADPDLQDADRRSALMYAAAHGDVRSVRALVHAGANLDLTDKDGNTAYDLAKGGRLSSPSLQKEYQEILDLVSTH
jgi:ankyrin repeat protein